MSRDLLTERMFHGWSFNFEEQERIDLARMVSKACGLFPLIVLKQVQV